ncbi:MAG: fumarylacetoacetate hydrolase family protein [Bacteroides sp.]|nr:fumarylacetoacetate hydrolase family protein [Bacteroides sp.]
MKTFVFDNNCLKEKSPEIVSWYFLADSSLTNAGKPFFIPDFAEEFDAIPTIAIRINRLGKSISPKFAERYYSEFAAALHFRAADLLHRLHSLNLSPDPATSFDRSFFMSEFMPLPPTGTPIVVKMKRNGEEVQELNTTNMRLSINDTIHHASITNTLKIGDLIVPALPPGIKASIGDTFELTWGEETPLMVQIK